MPEGRTAEPGAAGWPVPGKTHHLCHAPVCGKCDRVQHEERSGVSPTVSGISLCMPCMGIRVRRLRAVTTLHPITKMRNAVQYAVIPQR